jgi:hypothetical protein
MEVVSLPGKTRKRAKVRSVWISFAGRIAAQLIGSIATVTLGVVVLGGRHAPAAATPEAAPTVLIATPVRTHGETVIVMLPLRKDGTADEALAGKVAESYEKTKAAPPLADARRQTPIVLPVPRSGDRSDDMRESLASPRE